MIRQLMPWPCSLIQLDDWAEKKQRIYEFMEKYPYVKGRYQPLSNYDPIRFDPEKTSAAADFTNEVFGESIQQFGREIGAVGYNITMAWSQTSGTNMEQAIHNHGYKGFSATCYVDFDPEVHTSTVFYDNLPSFWDGIKRQMEIPNCKEGSLFIFPAYADHFARPNLSDKPRTIFAFNFIVTPPDNISLDKQSS